MTTRYLYGDATPSPLEGNYVRFLRDVLDYSVSVLAAAELVTKYERMAAELESSTKTELAQVRAVGKKITATLDACRGDNPPVVARCIDAIRTAAFNELKRAEGEVSSVLTGELDRIKRLVAQERANSIKRLELLLLRQDLPGTEHWINLQLAVAGGYSAELAGNASSEVSWLIELEVPSGHPLSQTMRVEQMMPGLAIKVPQESGWVRKSVKLRSHRVDNKYITGFTQTPAGTTIRLRNALDSDAGLDIAFAAKGNGVSLTQVGKGVTPEPFDPELEDGHALCTLRDKLLAAAFELRGSRRALREARLDGTPLQDHDDTKILVKRVIAQIAPVVKEIDKHTLAPDELVLKRVMSDDKREEVFVSKASLREKIAPLPPKLRSLFEPLGLGAIDAKQSKVSDAASTVEEVNSLQQMSELRMERLTDAPPEVSEDPQITVSNDQPPKAKQAPSKAVKHALPTAPKQPAATVPLPEAAASVGGVDVSLDDLED